MGGQSEIRHKLPIPIREAAGGGSYRIRQKSCGKTKIRQCSSAQIGALEKVKVRKLGSTARDPAPESEFGATLHKVNTQLKPRIHFLLKITKVYLKDGEPSYLYMACQTFCFGKSEFHVFLEGCQEITILPSLTSSHHQTLS